MAEKDRMGPNNRRKVRDILREMDEEGLVDGEEVLKEMVGLKRSGGVGDIVEDGGIVSGEVIEVIEEGELSKKGSEVDCGVVLQEVEGKDLVVGNRVLGMEGSKDSTTEVNRSERMMGKKRTLKKGINLSSVPVNCGKGRDRVHDVDVGDDGNRVGDKMVGGVGSRSKEVVRTVNAGESSGKEGGVQSGRAGKKTNRSNIRKVPRIKMLSWSFVPK